jgi:mycothiol synthase
MITSEIVIRPYEAVDADSLADAQQRVYRSGGVARRPLRQHLAALLRQNGRAWTLLHQGKPAGLAWIEPVPGLLAVFDLHGFIVPEKQRQGLGKYLLAHLRADLSRSTVKQMAHAVPSLTTSAAHFLQAQGFFVEHQEWHLLLPQLDNLPPVALPAATAVETLPKRSAITAFRRLYDQSFGDSPWYQPYDSDAAVAGELDETPGTILFLRTGQEQIGFIWLRLPQVDLGEIEPVGIVPAYQRQGYGRVLLTAGLHWLKSSGAKRVRLGVWRQNTAAVQLYLHSGFQRQLNLYYLACNLDEQGRWTR